MPQYTDPAINALIANLKDEHIGNKLRVLGRMLSYDVETGLMLLQDQGFAVLVDVSLCIDPVKSFSWIRDRKILVWAMGYLEHEIEELPIPILPAYSDAPTIDPSLVLRALYLTPALDVDPTLWNKTVAAQNDAPVLRFPPWLD